MKYLKNVATQVAFALILLVCFNSEAQITIDPNDPGNATNPFDDAGKMHNEAVKLFLENNKNSTLNVEEVINKSKETLKKLKINDGVLTLEQFQFGMSDAKNNFKNVINKTSMSSSGKLKLQELVNYMMDNGLEGKATINDFNNFIINYENQILSSRSYSKSDKEFLLKSSSVARHSSNFWYTYENSSSYENNADGNPPRWIRWVIVGVSDVVGGAAGGGAFSVASAATASLAIDNVIDETKN